MCYDGLRKTEGVSCLSHGKKRFFQCLLLSAGVVMICYGAWRGEADTVLSKAIKICLECVGIG